VGVGCAGVRRPSLEKSARASGGGKHMSIGVLMLLIAGAAFGFWLALDMLRADDPSTGRVDGLVTTWLSGFVFVLGGMSLIGPPLLLLTARRKCWGAGRFLWFVQGTAAWLLWPPAIYHRVAAAPGPPASISAVCFFYGTPPMALYVTLTLLAGGHLRPSRRLRMRRSWQEKFGLLLGLAWACTGLYLISLFYSQDFTGK
jgi:hypothetical protein